jgi:hypothetical protein
MHAIGVFCFSICECCFFRSRNSLTRPVAMQVQNMSQPQYVSVDVGNPDEQQYIVYAD